MVYLIFLSNIVFISSIFCVYLYDETSKQLRYKRLDVIEKLFKTNSIKSIDNHTYIIDINKTKIQLSEVEWKTFKPKLIYSYVENINCDSIDTCRSISNN